MANNDTALRLMQAFNISHRLRPQLTKGLRPREIRMLRSIKQLESEPGVMVSTLSRQWGDSPSSVTQTANGLVEREVDVQDRRAVRLNFTARGNEIVHKIIQEFMAAFTGLTQYLGEHKSRQLVEMMEQAGQYLDSWEVSHG